MHRELMVKDSFSEADNQQQNPVELHGIRWLKDKTRTLMDRTDCPDEGGLDTMRYLADVHNVLSDDTLGGKVPHTKRTGDTVDISPFLYFRYRQPVFYLDVDQAFPKSRERPGYWINVANNVGDASPLLFRKQGG